MSNANPVSGSGRRNGSGRYNAKTGYVTKSRTRRKSGKWQGKNR